MAEGTRTLDEQKEAEQAVQEGQVAGDRQALEKDDVVAEGGDAGAEEAEERAPVGDVLPRADTAAALQAEGQLAVREPAPQESPVAEDPQGQGTGKGMDCGTEAAAREQDILMEGTESEVALGGQASRGQEPAAAGREVDGAASEGEEEDGEVSEGEEAADEDEAEAGAEVEEPVGPTGSPVKEELGEMVSEEEEAMEEGGFAEKGIVAGAVSEGEEVAEDADMAEERIAGVVGPEEEEAVEEGISEEEEAVSEGEQAVEEAVSEGEEDVEKPVGLLETLEDTNICGGEAVPGEDFIKPHEFSQLQAGGEEWSEMGEAAAGAPETGRESGAGGGSVLRAGDAEGATAQPGKGPLLQIASGLEAPVDAGGDPRSEGSSQLEENTTAEEEEGSAEALSSGNPIPGGTAGSAAEDKPDGGAMGQSAETARAEVGAAGEAPGRAAGPGELAGQEVAVAGDSRVGDGVMAQEGVTEAAWGGQSGAGVAAAAEGVSAEGRGAAGHLGRDRGGVSDGAAAVGRGVNQEGRQLAPVGAEGQAETDTAHLVSPQHREVFPGEQPVAETSPSSPAQGAGRAEPGGTGSAGGEGPCPGSLQPAAPRTGANKDGAQEGTEPAGLEAEGEQPGLHGNTQETAGVWDGTRDTSGDSEQSQDGPVAGSPGALAAADERSRGPGEVSPAGVGSCSQSPHWWHWVTLGSADAAGQQQHLAALGTPASVCGKPGTTVAQSLAHFL